MNRYRKAFGICLAGGPIMIVSMLLSENTLPTSLIFGFMTVIITLVGMHLGIWTKGAA